MASAAHRLRITGVVLSDPSVWVQILNYKLDVSYSKLTFSVSSDELLRLDFETHETEMHPIHLACRM
jgi:hypothetical protein